MVRNVMGQFLSVYLPVNTVNSVKVGKYQNVPYRNMILEMPYRRTRLKNLVFK